MNELQLRIEVQGAVQNYVEQLLFQNGVPAHLVEDAFTKSLAYLKEKSLQEFVLAASTPSVPDESEGEEVENGE